jgi:hypothetical protein
MNYCLDLTAGVDFRAHVVSNSNVVRRFAGSSFSFTNVRGGLSFFIGILRSSPPVTLLITLRLSMLSGTILLVYCEYWECGQIWLFLCTFSLGPRQRHCRLLRHRKSA